jgi:hypothetical protein
MSTVGTIICCTSKDISQLLAGRTCHGVGAGGIQAMSYIIVSDIIPLRQDPNMETSRLRHGEWERSVSLASPAVETYIEVDISSRLRQMAKITRIAVGGGKREGGIHLVRPRDYS